MTQLEYIFLSLYGLLIMCCQYCFLSMYLAFFLSIHCTHAFMKYGWMKSSNNTLNSIQEMREQTTYFFSLHKELQRKLQTYTCTVCILPACQKVDRGESVYHKQTIKLKDSLERATRKAVCRPENSLGVMTDLNSHRQFETP